MRELIASARAPERTFGKFFRINPKVDDIPDTLAKEKNGVKLLLLGTVETGGTGCVCPEHVLLRSSSRTSSSAGTTWSLWTWKRGLSI